MWQVLRWPALTVTLCITVAALWPVTGLVSLLPLLVFWWVPVHPQIPVNLDLELQFLLND